MAHRMMKYRLAADGTVPTFLCLHAEGVGGTFVVADPAQPGNPEATIPFDPAVASDWAWGRLDALNATA